MIFLAISLLVWGVVLVLTRDRTKITYEYYPDKKVMSKISYVKVEDERILHGVTLHYHENGTVKSQLEYKGGRLDGVQVYYDGSGKAICKEIYINGSCIETFNY